MTVYESTRAPYARTCTIIVFRKYFSCIFGLMMVWCTDHSPNFNGLGGGVLSFPNLSTGWRKTFATCPNPPHDEHNFWPMVFEAFRLPQLVEQVGKVFWPDQSVNSVGENFLPDAICPSTNIQEVLAYRECYLFSQRPNYFDRYIPIGKFSINSNISTTNEKNSHHYWLKQDR